MEFPQYQIIVEICMKDRHKMGRKMELEKWKSGKMENSEKVGKKLQTMRPYATNCHLGLTHCPGF